MADDIQTKCLAVGEQIKGLLNKLQRESGKKVKYVFVHHHKDSPEVSLVHIDLVDPKKGDYD